jgi:outer membrane lipoprotein-sorting protein
MNLPIDTSEGLEKYLQQVKAQTPAKEQAEQAQQRLQQAIAGYQEIPVESESWLRRLKQRLSAMMPGRYVTWTGSAAICTLVFGLMFSATQTPAFAAVVEKLQQIASMSYSGVMSSNGQPIMDLQVYYQAPDKVRIENTPLAGQQKAAPVINILDVSQGKGLILMPGPKMATPFSFTPNQQSMQSVEDDPLYWFEAIKNHQGEVTTLPTKMVNGTEAVGYKIVEQNILITLWASVQTSLPVKVEVSMAGPGEREDIFHLEADLEFNRQLDPQLFSLTPDSTYRMGQDQQ